MKKICCIFNIPSLYREAIYSYIDKTYECEWFFDNEKTEIALFDTSVLKRVHILEYAGVFGCAYRMKGLLKRVLGLKDIDAYLMIGAPRCVSLWVVCVILKLFCPRKKIYFWTHGWYGKETCIERIAKKTFLELADDVFIYGNYAKGLLIKLGFNSDHLHVIHNSLSYETQLSFRKQTSAFSLYREHFGNDDPVILFIGRLTRVKKLNMLLEAVVVLVKEGEGVNLILVGDGAEEDALRKRAIDLGISERVWFYGASYDEKSNSELIYNADVCVAPGNIGLTAVHSLMYGCPVISHNDFPNQMPEFEAIKPYYTGLFFDRDSVPSLVSTIREWFFFAVEQRDAIRQNCYNEVDENWTPEFQMKVLKTVLG